MITILAVKPVAYDSPDHMFPVGTLNDNSVSVGFNRKLYELIPAPLVRLLDLGCAGGGLVKSILDDGGFAVGVEGSDRSRKAKRAEWATIPRHLFTADCTDRFMLFETGFRPGSIDAVHFNVITAWEFWEHIAEDRLAGVVRNIRWHLQPDGFCIGSVATFDDWQDGKKTPVHQTLHPKPWWIDKFQELGLKHAPDIEDHFQGDLVRGGYDPNGPSFSLALRP